MSDKQQTPFDAIDELLQTAIRSALAVAVVLAAGVLALCWLLTH